MGYKSHFIQKAHFKLLKPERLFFCDKLHSDFKNVLVLPSAVANNDFTFLFNSKPRIVLSGNNTMKSYLRNNCTKKLGNNACVYAIPCNNCNEKYIGESNDIPNRIYQHKYSVRKCDFNNPVFKHIANKDHVVHINNYDTICKIQNTTHRKFIESFLISSLPNFNNNVKSSEIIDNNTCNILKKYVKSFKKLFYKLDSG